MSRIRPIKPDWLDDERLALASSDARVMSVALILLADDYGNGRASRALLSGRVFPTSPMERTDAALTELIDNVGFVRLYEVDRQRYYSIRNWAKHQRVDHPGKPKVPAPPELTSKSRKSSRKSRETLSSSAESLENIVDGVAPRAIPSPPFHSIPDPDQTRAGGKDDPDPEDRETVCPADLFERSERAGIVDQFAKRFRVAPDVVRHHVLETLDYWTVGTGTGRRKRNWMQTVRARLHELQKSGRLDVELDDGAKQRVAIAAGTTPQDHSAQLQAAEARRIARMNAEAKRELESNPDLKAKAAALAKGAPLDLTKGIGT